MLETSSDNEWYFDTWHVFSLNFVICENIVWDLHVECLFITPVRVWVKISHNFVLQDVQSKYAYNHRHNSPQQIW